MKRKIVKLTLNRETLLLLSGDQLKKADGGDGGGTIQNSRLCTQTACDSICKC